ncbi:hypothetical protein K449DRAFT_432614 [Hypoxylon sp. EC38]|nr:hypothetical protein K449DRAFT_432614 [Hypoxylon sp. EC38]
MPLYEAFYSPHMSLNPGVFGKEIGAGMFVAPDLGVGAIHGVPGNYNISLLDYAKPAGLHWVGNANELNAGYATDGYTRIKGIGVLITTFDAGKLSATNAIAGSYAEPAAVVHIIDTPKRASQDGWLLVRHTFNDGEFTRFNIQLLDLSKIRSYTPHPQDYWTISQVPLEIILSDSFGSGALSRVSQGQATSYLARRVLPDTEFGICHFRATLAYLLRRPCYHILRVAQGASLAQRELVESSQYYGIKDARTIPFIDDGSFQTTVQELGIIIRKNLDVLLFLINNDNKIERCIQGLWRSYNDIASWRYSQAPSFFGL